MRSFLALAASLLASLTLAACSGGDSVALDPVAQAADRTNATGSSRIVMEMSVGMGNQKFFVNAEGAMDYKRRRGWLLMDMSQLAALTPGAPEIPRLNMVFENTTVWMRVPPTLAASTGGKQWLRMSLGSTSNAFGGMQQPDPSQMLDALRGLSGSVTKVGKTQVRGAQTTHYTADVSLDKALAQAPPEQRKAAMATLKMFDGLEKVPVDLYIDDAGRVRRMEMEYDLKSAGMTFESEVRMELFDFGTRVAFKRPPKSQTAELSSLVD